MGMNWEDVSLRLGQIGVTMTASSLMTKHSRASFKAVEYVQILMALGVSKLELPLDAVKTERGSAWMRFVQARLGVAGRTLQFREVPVGWTNGLGR